MGPERIPPKDDNGWLEKILAPIINIVNTWFENLMGKKNKK